MILSALAIIGGLLHEPMTANAQDAGSQAMVSVTEEGDSIVIYERPIFDFGPPNPGNPDSVMRMLHHRETKEELEAMHQEALRRDKLQLQAAASRRRTLSASSGGYGPDESLPVGKIPVQEGVTPTGARTYTVPIATAPGIAFAPQLALYYNSQSSYGAAGYGWSISGLSAITISNKTEYYNGEAGPADYTDTDAVYALDGMPLVKNSVTALDDEYQLETARGHIIVKKHMDGSRVSHFTALYPDGSRATFGQEGNKDSMQYTYPVTEIEDVRGGRIVFEYLPYIASNGYMYYISSIEYGFGDDGTPAGRIEFDYEDNAYAHNQYFAGICTKSKKLLKSVTSYSGDEELVRYDLEHELDGNEFRLTSIECSSDGKTLNPLEFSYGDGMIDNPGDMPDIARKDRLTLSNYFSATDDVDIVYKRGKFIDGAVGDGLIAYPNFSTYSVTGYVKKWVLGKKHDLYGSTFASDQKILIAPILTSSSGIQSIEAGLGFQCVEAVDTDGDGVDEIVRVNFRDILGDYTLLTMTVYEFDATMTLVEKSSISTLVAGVVNNGDVAYSPAQRIYTFGDYIGNGKVQMLTTLYDSDLNGAARTSYSALIDIESGEKLSESHIIDLKRGTNEQYLSSLDIDNDGRTELCWAMAAGLEIYNLSSENVFNLTRRLSGMSSSDFPKPDDENCDMSVADINGDGYPDFIRRNGGAFKIFLFTGRDFVYRTTYFDAPGADDELMFYDINWDGLADLVHRSGTKLYFYLNEKGMISDDGKISSRTTLSEKTKFLPCNVLNWRSMAVFATIDGGEILTYDFSQNVSEDRLLTMFTDSHDVVTINEYENMASSTIVYRCESDRIYGEGFGKKNFSLPLLRHARSYIFPSMTTLSQLSYRYFDVAYNWQGLGFCGFGKVETTDHLGSPDDYVSSTVTYDPTKFGAALSEERALWDDLDNPFSVTTNKYDSHSTAYGKLNPRLTSSSNTNSLTGVTTTVSYKYGDYDQPSEVTVTKRSDRVLTDYKIPFEDTIFDVELDTTHVLRPYPGDSLIVSPGLNPKASSDSEPLKYVVPDSSQEKTEFTYDNYVSPSLYLLGQPVSMQVARTRPYVSSWVERRTWEYDDELMLPVKIIDYVGEEGDSKLRETRLSYDDYGNVTSETSASYNSSAFIGDSYTYDGSGRLLLSCTDALGRTETCSGHNKFGKPTIVTDDKGRVTQIAYDEWGNEISRTYPEGSKEETLVQWGGEGLYTVTHTLTGQPSEVTHYDAGDRVLRTGTLRFDGSWLYTDREYIEGRLMKVSMPFKGDGPSLWNTYEYDDYNRKSRFTEASGSVTEWSYDEWKVTETRNGTATVRTYDVDGNMVEIEDDGGRIAYVYRTDGQPETVGRPKSELVYGGIVWGDVGGESLKKPIKDIRWVLEDAVQLKYDDFGRRTLIGDPSAGIQTDTETWAADGSSTVVHTNRNGTITTKRDRYGRVTEIDREGEYATTYTYDSDGLLLGEVSTNGTSRSYSYDGFDRLLTETETVPDGKWLRKDYSYTSGSRVASIKYTSQSGEITTEHYTWVNGYNTAVRTQDGRTVWSLMSENELGLPTKALTGTVERSYSYTACGQIAGRTIEGMQDFGYSFSPLTGNLTARTDRTRSITENFGYDSLNRLTDNDGQAVTYAENGNITSMEAVGTFTYGKSSRPYQVTEAELTGDDIYPERDQTVSYTSFSRPSRLNEGGRSASFTYNGSHERVKMYVADGTEAVLTRYYIGGRYELDMADGTTVERLYLDGDAYSAPMVMVRESGSGWKLLNIGRDHLGSVTHLATYDGTLVAEYSYDAWGRLRDPETQEIYGSGEESELLLGRGFTGHEHLPWFGLVNMNARLYDPALGRFLSPDPYIQLPDFTQNFNRYSYGLNNPLVCVDENGEWIHIAVGAIVGAVMNLVANWDSIDNFWEGLAVGLVGGGAGALTAATGGATAGFMASAAAGIGAAVVGGATVSFTNNLVQQLNNSPDSWSNVNWKAVGINTGVGALLGAVSYGAGTAIDKTNIVPKALDLFKIEYHTTQNIAGSTLQGALVGLSTGAVFGVTEGAMTGDWSNIWKRIGLGTAFGAGSGFMYGTLMESAYQMNLHDKLGSWVSGEIAESVAGSVRDGINGFNDQAINFNTGVSSYYDQSGNIPENMLLEISPEGHWISPLPYEQQPK